MSLPVEAGRRALQALWTVVLPATLAVLAIVYLVPVAGSGVRGIVAGLGRKHTVLFGVSIFLVLSAVAQYWRPYLPGTAFIWPAAGPDAGAPPRARAVRDAAVLVAMVGAAVGVAVAFRAFIARPYQVVGPSMLPTLEPDDLVAGRMHPYGPSNAPGRGDVIAFRGAAVPGDSGFTDIVVKRVIGLPGDRIEMYSGGVPVINGWPVPNCDAGEFMYVLPEPGDDGLHGRLRVEFLDDRAYLVVLSKINVPFPDPYVVQPGEVFVLGDNRGNSTDSRELRRGHGGGIPLGAIEARPQWFLAGTHRSGDVDVGRTLTSIDGLQLRIRMEGVQVHPLEEGIARCLRDRPKDTHPPAP